MKLLLDTHVLLWAAGSPDQLPPPAPAVTTRNFLPNFAKLPSIKP